MNRKHLIVVLTWFLLLGRSPLRGVDMVSHCCSCKSMSSNPRTSSCGRFVPTFSRHTVRRFGQSSTHFFLLPFKQQLILFAQNHFLIFLVATWLLERNSFFKPLQVGLGVPYLLFPTLALHECYVVPYNAWHTFFDG